MTKFKKEKKYKSSNETKQFHKKQISSLKRGKIKSLGFFEKMALRHAGRRDGKRGLPAKEDGIWRSPYLDAEVKKYQEFCFKMWGRLQLTSEDSLTRVSQLLETIPETERALAESKTALADECKRIRLRCGTRRKGEETLTEEQVYRRREKEFSSQLLPLQGRVHTLEKILEQETEELLFLRSSLKELEQSTSMICGRVLEHTKLRAAAYWDAALKHHPENLSLPMTPVLEIVREAELTYRQSCARLLGNGVLEGCEEKEEA